MRLILGSASPARLAVLRSAGITPVVRESGLDEDALVATMPDAPPEAVVTALALAKARSVAASSGTEYPDAVVVGCDSMLRIDGELVGKPGNADIARRRWKQMVGNTGELLTGHGVVRLHEGSPSASTTAVRTTGVHFGTPSTEEIEAYLGTGEPLRVAGGFTLDGRGGWFVEGVIGDPSSVIGISLPLLRELLANVGVSVVSLWDGNL